MSSEAQLQAFLAEDPTILGEPLLVIGREVPTPYGTRIDILAMDVEGNLHVLELKRDRTPREVVAQILKPPLSKGSQLPNLGVLGQRKPLQDQSVLVNKFINHGLKIILIERPRIITV
ncbi:MULTISPECIES: endonuclease NucS domain-containing protein [Micrococcus]|nr:MULTISPECIES: endonuclease NucS domain-containing protein [Micrococcus]